GAEGGGERGPLPPRAVAQDEGHDRQGDRERAEEDQEDPGRVRRCDHRGHQPVATQNGPCGGWLIVFVPRGGPRTTLDVSTTTWSPCISTVNRSRPRGAGPNWYSPAAPSYFDPWHGHSNHCDCWQNGTRPPRCTHSWYSGMMPFTVTPSAG